MNVKSTKKALAPLQRQKPSAGAPLDFVADHNENVLRILPALNLAELLAMRELWISLVWLTVWVPPCQVKWQCCQETIHNQRTAKTLQKQVVHQQLKNGGQISYTVVDWNAGLNAQDSELFSSLSLTGPGCEMGGSVPSSQWMLVGRDSAL